MAEEMKLFKGIKQVTEATYTAAQDKAGILWFVKRTDGYGDIYLGDRHYGHWSDTEAEDIKKIGEIESKVNEAVSDSTTQAEAIKKIEDILGEVSGYEYKEVAEDKVPEDVRNGEGVAEVPGEADKDSADFVKVVTTGDSATTTYYQKEVKSVSEVIKSIQSAVAEIKEQYKVKSVAAADKILSLSEAGELSSSLSLEYKDNKIYLYGKTKDEAGKIGEVDCTDFIKDGMLDTAEIVEITEENGKFVYGETKTEAAGVNAAGKYIRLHWNTDSADKQDVFLSVGEIVAAYTGGKDIKVNGNNSIDVALSEDITVAGLNDTYGCGLIKNGNTIKAGTSLSDILKMMLSKEINPKAATKPSISISTSSPVSGLHEIGEQVNVGTASISKTNGKFNNDGWSSPAQPTAEFSWSDEKMSSKLTAGATGYESQSDVTSIAQGTAVTAKGINTVSISASASYSAPTNKPITNLKNEYDGTEATWTVGTDSASTTITWTGVYPCFVNSNALGAEPATKLALTSGKEFNITVASHTDNDFRFAYPDGWTIASFQVKSLDGKYYDYAGSYEGNAGDIEKTIQGNAVKYHYLSVKNGASDYKIILNKKLNA